MGWTCSCCGPSLQHSCRQVSVMASLQSGPSGSISCALLLHPQQILAGMQIEALYWQL